MISRMFEAGEGVADITPPLGVELAGFHKPVGQERVVTGIRQPTAARALADYIAAPDKGQRFFQEAGFKPVR